MGEGLKRVAKACGGLTMKSGNSVVRYDANGKAKRKRPRRRKCYICGKFDDPKNMVHGGYGKVMHSEAHFAHKTCGAKNDRYR